MQIEVADVVFKPGDKVFIPVDKGGRVAPEPVVIDLMVVALRADNTTEVSYFDKHRQELPKSLYAEPWSCGEAIEVLERHRRQAEEEIQKIKERAKERRKQ